MQRLLRNERSRRGPNGSKRTGAVVSQEILQYTTTKRHKDKHAMLRKSWWCGFVHGHALQPWSCRARLPFFVRSAILLPLHMMVNITRKTLHGSHQGCSTQRGHHR